MPVDHLTADLRSAIDAIALIDPHTHINPLQPASKSLDDILGYHYYTELAHSVGMSQEPLAPSVPARERVRAILTHMPRYDNTAQYAWFLDICKTFLGYDGEPVSGADADRLCDAAERLMAQADWEQQVLTRSKLEGVFLTNEFDDPLEGFDTRRYIPCLRTDDLVFKLDQPSVRERLAQATGVEVHDRTTLRQAVGQLFRHFTSKGARACAISLPPDFRPQPAGDFTLTSDPVARSQAVFWTLAEHCRDFKLPFDLMIGVNRRVYRAGVFQGQDLFDNRTSLMLYAELFNAFPTVPFCVSILSSTLNQELCSFAWIFPNVITSGHWWYANVPALIAMDLRARLQAVPKTKQIGYYSDMYKLEFGLPKFNMYRSVLANVLAADFVRPGLLSETRAVELARYLLRDNVQTIFRVSLPHG
jgi:glucuronate isomerase